MNQLYSSIVFKYLYSAPQQP